ncbi:hypothetical protein H5410_042485, partial [Solanum commersonii]
MEVSPVLHTHKSLTRPGMNRYHSNSCSHLLQFMASFPPPPWEAEAAENSQTVGNPHAQSMQNNQLLPGSPHALPMHNNQLMSGSPNALSMQNSQLMAAINQQLAGGSNFKVQITQNNSWQSWEHVTVTVTVT